MALASVSHVVVRRTANLAHCNVNTDTFISLHDIFVVIARRAVAAAAHTRSRTRSVTLWRRVLSHTTHHIHTCTHTDTRRRTTRPSTTPPESRVPVLYADEHAGTSSRRATRLSSTSCSTATPRAMAARTCFVRHVRPRWRPLVGHHSRPSSAHWPLRSSPPPPPFIRSHSSRLPLQTSQLPSATRPFLWSPFSSRPVHTSPMRVRVRACCPFPTARAPAGLARCAAGGRARCSPAARHSRARGGRSRG